MSYADAHLYRVGTNYQQLPANKPRCPVMHYQRDGNMSHGLGGSSPNYFPNSVDGTPKEDPSAAEPPLPLGDVAADRYDSAVDHDDYTQAGMLWNIMPEAEKQRTAKAIAGALSGATEEIQMRQLCHFFRADGEYGKQVAEALGVDVSAFLSRESV
jgi:catalase